MLIIDFQILHLLQNCHQTYQSFVYQFYPSLNYLIKRDTSNLSHILICVLLLMFLLKQTNYYTNDIRFQITEVVPPLRLDRLWIFSSSPSSKISFYTLDNLSSYFWVICRYTHCKTDDHTSKRPPFISYCMHCNWPKLLVFRLGSCSTRFRNLYFKYCLRTICHNLRVNL